MEIQDFLASGLITDEEAKEARARILGTHNNPTATSTDAALTAYFKSAELRTQQPWRKQYEHYQALIKDWEATPLETLREVFTDKAKNGLLQPSEAMLGIYLLYGGERELDFLRRLLVNASGSLRTMMHNFFVAEHRDPSFLTMFGGKVAELQEPLFPHTKEFTALNSILLQQHETTLGGGEKRSLFQREEEADPLGGGPNAMFAVLTSPEGHQYVDLSVIESVCDGLQGQVTTLRNLKQKGSTWGGPKQPWWKKKAGGQGQGHQPYAQQGPQAYANQAPPQYHQGRGNPAGAGDPSNPPSLPGSSTPPSASKRN